MVVAISGSCRASLSAWWTRGVGGEDSADPADFLHEVAREGAAWPPGTDGITVKAGALIPEWAGWMKRIR